MIKTLIIDDEDGSIELISNLMKLNPGPEQVVATAGSVATGYTAILQHQPDLVFLDVEMQDGSGFELLRKLNDVRFRLIFITAHQEFAIEAFKYSALDYLLKPLSPMHFTEALRKVRQSISDEEIKIKMETLLHNSLSPSALRKKIVLRTMDKIYALHLEEITRFESEGNYTKVFLLDGKKIMVSRLIKDFDEMLTENGFIRIHQSHLVNTAHIFCFEKQESQLVMRDNAVVPASTRKKDMLLDYIERF